MLPDTNSDSLLSFKQSLNVSLTQTFTDILHSYTCSLYLWKQLFIIHYTHDGDIAIDRRANKPPLPISFMPSSLVADVCSSYLCSQACSLVCVGAVKGVSVVLPLLPGLSSTGYSSVCIQMLIHTPKGIL